VLFQFRELTEHIEEWPPELQAQAIASLEAIAGYISLQEQSQDGAVGRATDWQKPQVDHRSVETRAQKVV
jgi:hypothetical protein